MRNHEKCLDLCHTQRLLDTCAVELSIFMFVELNNFISLYSLDCEYWLESDEDIDLDMNASALPPQDLPVDDTENQGITAIVRWMLLLVSLFQSKFSITDRAISWLLLLIHTF